MEYSLETTYNSPAAHHYRITVENAIVEGVEIPLPGTTQYLLVIHCAKGMLACRLISEEVSAKLKLPIAIFSAARIENMLTGKPAAVSDAAAELGITKDMVGWEIIKAFSVV